MCVPHTTRNRSTGLAGPGQVHVTGAATWSQAVTVQPVTSLRSPARSCRASRVRRNGVRNGVSIVPTTNIDRNYHRFSLSAHRFLIHFDLRVLFSFSFSPPWSTIVLMESIQNNNNNIHITQTPQTDTRPSNNTSGLSDSLLSRASDCVLLSQPQQGAIGGEKHGFFQT